jgi:two-component system sensor histidine kinase PhoQ
LSSLRRRVLVSALAVLTAFVVLTSLALERAFRDSAGSAREERLLGQLYLLMAAAEGAGATLLLPDELAEPRFGLPGSGLYAAVLDATGRPVWRSISTLSGAPPLEGALPPGDRRLDVRANEQGEEHLVERYGVRWAIGDTPATYTFVVAEDLAPYREELARFRSALSGWLGGTSLLMLAALLAAMHWGLAPLRRVSAEVVAIEQGTADRIRGDYPRELRALTDNLNALLAHERALRKRLDDALGDLAHSLKTPLAVIRNELGENRIPEAMAVLLEEQVERMGRIVEHQLQRARADTGAAAALATAVPIAATVERLVTTLAKVYREKGITVRPCDGTPCLAPPVQGRDGAEGKPSATNEPSSRGEVDMSPGLNFRVEGDRVAIFRGTEGDLIEILGNLLDNAFKWARRQVRVDVRRSSAGVEIRVEDDGPGIPLDQVARLLARGSRGDEAPPGHGLGLAIARNVCEAYGGTLAIERSALGGTAIRIGLPG